LPQSTKSLQRWFLDWRGRHSFDAHPDYAGGQLANVIRLGRTKMSRLRIIASILILTTVVCLGAIAIESQAKIIRRSYDNFVLDNWNHYLPCEKLPTEAEVRATVQRYQDVIQAIEQVNPELVGVDIDSSTCPGKADLVIWYASHQNRLAIETIIGGDTFFGVPYRLQNR
jgi:hypothetical protein